MQRRFLEDLVGADGDEAPHKQLLRTRSPSPQALDTGSTGSVELGPPPSRLPVAAGKWMRPCDLNTAPCGSSEALRLHVSPAGVAQQQHPIQVAPLATVLGVEGRCTEQPLDVTPSGKVAHSPEALRTTPLSTGVKGPPPARPPGMHRAPTSPDSQGKAYPSASPSPFAEAQKRFLEGLQTASSAMSPEQKDAYLGGLATCSLEFTPSSTRAPTPRQLLSTPASSCVTGPPPSWLPGTRHRAGESSCSTCPSQRCSSIVAKPLFWHSLDDSGAASSPTQVTSPLLSATPQTLHLGRQTALLAGAPHTAR